MRHRKVLRSGGGGANVVPSWLLRLFNDQLCGNVHRSVSGRLLLRLRIYERDCGTLRHRQVLRSGVGGANAVPSRLLRLVDDQHNGDMQRAVRGWLLLPRWFDKRDGRALPRRHVPHDAGRHKLVILPTDARGLLELVGLSGVHSLRGRHVPHGDRRNVCVAVLGLPRRLRVPIALSTSGAVRCGRVQPGQRNELYTVPRGLQLLFNVSGADAVHRGYVQPGQCDELHDVPRRLFVLVNNGAADAVRRGHVQSCRRDDVPAVPAGHVVPVKRVE